LSGINFIIRAVTYPPIGSKTIFVLNYVVIFLNYSSKFKSDKFKTYFAPNLNNIYSLYLLLTTQIKFIFFLIHYNKSIFPKPEAAAK